MKDRFIYEIYSNENNFNHLSEKTIIILLFSEVADQCKDTKRLIKEEKYINFNRGLFCVIIILV